MKVCPNCKAELDDQARFCLCCMTSLDEKEQIPPPVQKARRWPLVLLCSLGLCACMIILVVLGADPPEDTTVSQTPTVPQTLTTPLTSPNDTGLLFQTVDSVTYTFRPATAQEYPTAVKLEQHYALIRVEGTPSDGIYRVPTFVGQDTGALVSVVAKGAFDGTDAKAIDLGHNVRYVWGNAFGGYPLTDLYLHEDVLIEQEAFSGCGEALTIHCPEYLENTEGRLWSELAAALGFQWQQEVL